jgi:hypothetical protein
VGISPFLNQISETIRHPGLDSIVPLAAIGVVILAALLGISRWLKVHTEKRTAPKT